MTDSVTERQENNNMWPDMICYTISIYSEYAAKKAFHMMKSDEVYRKGGLFSYLQLKPPEEASYADRKGQLVLWKKANNYELNLHFPAHNEQKVKEMLEYHGRDLLHLHASHELSHMTIARKPYNLRFIPIRKK